MFVCTMINNKDYSYNIAPFVIDYLLVCPSFCQNMVIILANFKYFDLQVYMVVLLRHIFHILMHTSGNIIYKSSVI